MGGAIVTVSRQGGLRAGAEIRLGGQTHTVAAVSGISVRLNSVTGSTVEIPLAVVLSDPTLELVAGGSAPLPSAGALEVVDGELLEQARWWERHILEVLTGKPPDVVAGQAGRPEYEPAVTTLRQRELAKVAELAAGGRRVSLKTLQRLRLGYEREGLWALVEGRATRSTSTAGRVDARVVEAAQQAIKRGWTFATGKQPPSATDPDTPLAEAAIWALASGVGIGLTQFTVTRFAASRWAKDMGTKAPKIPQIKLKV